MCQTKRENYSPQFLRFCCPWRDSQRHLEAVIWPRLIFLLQLWFPMFPRIPFSLQLSHRSHDKLESKLFPPPRDRFNSNFSTWSNRTHRLRYKSFIDFPFPLSFFHLHLISLTILEFQRMKYSTFVPTSIALVGMVLADCPAHTVMLNSTLESGCFPCNVGVDSCATTDHASDKMYAVAW